jgi:hypothetical protein
MFMQLEEDIQDKDLYASFKEVMKEMGCESEFVLEIGSNKKEGS